MKLAVYPAHAYVETINRIDLGERGTLGTLETEDARLTGYVMVVLDGRRLAGLSVGGGG